MAEEQNNGQVAEVQKSYDDMSLEELEAEFARTGGVVSDEPLNEPDEVLADQPDEAQPVPEEAISPDEEASPHTPAPESESPPEPDLPDESQLQMQEMRLELERMRQDRERFEYQSGRATGEVGFLKQELRRLRETQAQPQSYDDLDYQQAEAPTAQPQPRTPSALEGQVAELQESQKASAVEKVYNDFLNQMADDLKAQGVEQDMLQSEQEAIMEKINPTLAKRFESFGDVSTLNAKSLEKVTRMVLQGAYTDTKLAKIADLRRKAAERKASQIADSRIVKQAASPSGSGGRPVKEPPPKSPSEMTAEEADAALIAEFGDGRANLRGRRR